MSSKVKSAITTGAFTVLVIVLMLFVSGYTFEPLPPKTPPDGFEVALAGSEPSLGEPEHGQGTDPAPSQKQNTSTPTTAPPATTKTPAQPNGVGQVNAGDKDIKSDAKPEEPKAPVINQNALYKGNRTNKNDGTGQGFGETNTPGNQGKDDGKNGGKGTGGHGTGYDFGTREAVKRDMPKNNTGLTGRVVVRACIDRNGYVIPNSVEYEPKGSNGAEGALRKLAIESAKKWRFDAPDNAPERVCGKITFNFENKTQ